MDVKMKMPDLSTTGAEVRIMSWLVPLGGQVTRGVPLLEVETDKATMEVESIVSGVLKQIVAPPETNVAVGDVIAVIEVAQPAAAPRPAAAPQADTGGDVTAGGGGATAPQPAGAAKSVSGAAGSSTPAGAPTGAPARGMFARNRAKPPEAPGGTTPPAVAPTSSPATPPAPPRDEEPA